MDETIQTPPSLRSQSAWIMFAKISSFILGILLPFLVVRYLTQEKVGVYRQTFQVITTAVSILPLGFSMSAYYFLNRETARRKAAVLNILIFNFVTGGLACLGLWIYPQFLGTIFQSEEMTLLAPKIGLVIWLWIFSTFLEVIAIANREARTATVFIILSQFTKTALMAGAVVLFATIEAFLYAAIIQAIFQISILIFYLNYRFPRFWLEFDLKFFWEQTVYTLPYGLAGVIWTLQTDLHNYFVGYRFSEAEYAIYAYGCFQLPLMGILAESTAAVLIPRMSELQLRNDKREIIKLTARAMQKLSFFYFPAYVFFLITANVFITTLFTKSFEASVPIFLIFITLVPFNILITDPIVRAYQELGRMLLKLRMFGLIGLVIALYFGIQYFDLRGMIAIVVVAALTERAIWTYILARKINVRRSDWKLLKSLGKTAVASVLTGVITYLAYLKIIDWGSDFGVYIVRVLSPNANQNIVDFVAGSMTLAITFVVFTSIYLFVANLFRLIEDDEKEILKSFLKMFVKWRVKDFS